jgi:altronate dehydratase
MTTGILVIHPADNVAVALQSLPAGSTVDAGDGALQIETEIPCGHKFARRAIASGQPVLKFGQPIGFATADIPAGAWVHTHNVRTTLEGVLPYGGRLEKPGLNFLTGPGNDIVSLTALSAARSPSSKMASPCSQP